MNKILPYEEWLKTQDSLTRRVAERFVKDGPLPQFSPRCVECHRPFERELGNTSNQRICSAACRADRAARLAAQRVSSVGFDEDWRVAL